MAGYREFRAGEVWFYYNPASTKDAERKNELGAVTSRPVVIVQDAFYPEWHDSITVVPLTSSDRRSGVHIDPTIFHDGSLVEGGTVLPYLLYTVKTKFLTPMCTDRKGYNLRLLTLSKEDFAEVRNGVAYHLGFSERVPEYVRNWKHLDDYTRSTITRNIRCVVQDYDIGNGATYAVPLIQTIDPTTKVENHVHARFDTISLDRSRFLNGNETEVLETPDSPPVIEPPAVNQIFDLSIAELTKLQKERRKTASSIIFAPYTVEAFLEKVDEEFSDGMEMAQSRIYPGSDLLTNVAYSEVISVLTYPEAVQVRDMSINDIMEMTGAKSSSTASRIRMAIREAFPKEEEDETQDESASLPYPIIAPFQYTPPKERVNVSRLRRNARLNKIFFSFTKKERLEMVTKPNEELLYLNPAMTPATCRRLKMNIAQAYPNELVGEEKRPMSEVEAEIAQTVVEDDTRKEYDFWETLAPKEIQEIASVSKRNVQAIAKRYGLTRPELQVVRLNAIELTRKNSMLVQPPIDDVERHDVCERVVKGDYHGMGPHEILCFCRTDQNAIMKLYANLNKGTTPSKSEMMALRRKLRASITRPPKKR